MTFLQSLFGPRKELVWAKIAEEVGGSFTEGGWFTSAKIVVDADPWTITLDTFVEHHGKTSTTYTRLTAPYVNPSRFRFDVSPENFLSGIGRFFGMQDVDVGVPEFDASWVVQGTDEAKLRRLFQDARIRSYLGAAGPVSFRVVDDEGWFGRRFPNGVDMLVLTTRGVERDLERLRVFFALFADTLDRLVELGDAERTPPRM